MSAEYTVSNYMGIVLFCSVVILILAFTLWPMIGYRMMKRFQKAWVFGVLLAGIILTFLPVFLFGMPVFEQTGDLLFPQEYTLRKAAGVVERISPVDHPQPCQIDGKVYWLNSAYIEGKTYLTVGDGKLQPGMLVQLEYAAFENNVILSWEETTQQQAELVRQEQLKADLQPPPVEPVVEIPQERLALGRILGLLAFGGFVGYVALGEMFRQKIVIFLFRKDARVFRKIVPNIAGIILSMLPFVFFLFLLLSIFLQNADFPGFFLIFVAALIGLLLANGFTSLTLDGQYVIIRRLGRQYEYEVSQLNIIMWQNCRGFIGKKLTIRFDDGKFFEFDMDLCSGVQNTYNELTVRMNSNTTR